MMSDEYGEGIAKNAAANGLPLICGMITGLFLDILRKPRKT